MFVVESQGRSFQSSHSFRQATGGAGGPWVGLLYRLQVLRRRGRHSQDAGADVLLGLRMEGRGTASLHTARPAAAAAILNSSVVRRASERGHSGGVATVVLGGGNLLWSEVPWARFLHAIFCEQMTLDEAQKKKRLDFILLLRFYFSFLRNY